MNYSIPGYDAWKTASPDYFDDPVCECDGCGCEVSEIIAETSGLCEDCECTENCEGCIHCLSEVEAEAKGLL